MIRPLEPEDLPALRILAGRPEIAAELDVEPEQLEAWVVPSSARVALGAFDGAALAAAASLLALERPRMRHVGRVATLGLPARAAELVSILREDADRWWRLDRVELALPDDAPLRMLAERAGFAPELLRRGDFERGGQRVDSALLAWLRPGMASAATAAPISRAAQRSTMSIEIRPTTPDDGAGFAKILREPSVRWGTLQVPHTSNATWQKRLASNDPAKHKTFVAVVDGEIAGTAGLHALGGPRRAHVFSLGMSVAHAWQGQGVGRRLMERLMETADALRCPRVELDVYTDNARAIALYEKFGFVREGIKRLEAWRDGAFADALVMARLAP